MFVCLRGVVCGEQVLVLAGQVHQRCRVLAHDVADRPLTTDGTSRAVSAAVGTPVGSAGAAVGVVGEVGVVPLVVAGQLACRVQVARAQYSQQFRVLVGHLVEVRFHG